MIYALYRRLSPFFKSLANNLGLSSGHCRYSPTCSRYAKEAISRHGILIGGWLSIKRLLKCHPWSRGGVDHVPQ